MSLEQAFFEVDDSREEIPNGIPLLKHATRQAANLDREVLHCRRRSQTPDSPHADTKQRPSGQELFKSLSKSGAELKDADEEEIGDQGPFSTVSV